MDEKQPNRTQLTTVNDIPAKITSTGPRTPFEELGESIPDLLSEQRGSVAEQEVDNDEIMRDELAPSVGDEQYQPRDEDEDEDGDAETESDDLGEPQHFAEADFDEDNEVVVISQFPTDWWPETVHEYDDADRGMEEAKFKALHINNQAKLAETLD